MLAGRRFSSGCLQEVTVCLGFSFPENMMVMIILSRGSLSSSSIPIPQKTTIKRIDLNRHNGVKSIRKATVSA